jgi:hypothetical protein
MREITGSYGEVLHIVAGVMVVSMILPPLLSPPHASKHARETPVAVPAEAGPGDGGH